MWLIWILLTAVASTVVFHRFGKKRYHWIEVTGQFLVAFLVSFGVVKLGNLYQATDTEYWGDTLDRIVYEGAYEDWVYDPCCTTHECNCTTDKDGNRSCSTCCDGCWKCVTRGPYRIKVGRSGGHYSGVRQDEYNRTVKSLGYTEHVFDPAATEKRRRSMNHTGSCNRDDGIYRADWKGTVETAENIVTEHYYENKIRYSNSTYGFDKPSSEEARRRGLVNYNSVNSYYQPDVHGALGGKMPGYQQAVRKLALFNGDYGKSKQIKVMIFVVPYSEDVLFWQKQFLEGGNKNEFIICLAVDKYNVIKKAGVISWTEAFGCINGVENWLGQYEGNNLEEILDNTLPIIHKEWRRREFTPLNDIVTMEPPVWVMILAIVLQCAAGFGLFYLFTNNYMDESDKLF